MRFIDRARLDANVGNHDSQVFWTEPSPGAVGLPSSGTHALSLEVMDQWLTNIERDTRDVARETKVAQDKPPLARDGCFQSGKPVAQSSCDKVQTPDVLAIQVAGAPMAANVLKCQLTPLDRFNYGGITFTDAEWAQLKAAFPHGVCDWTRKGVGQQAPTGSWLTYADTVGGTPLPAAPVSVPIGARAPAPVAAAGSAPADSAAAAGAGTSAARNASALPATGTDSSTGLVGLAALTAVALLARVRRRRAGG